MTVLGFSGLYHDSAAALLEDGRIVAAAQEERFTRIKNDDSFPSHAIEYCLGYGKKKLEDMDAVVYYDSPGATLGRFLKNALHDGEDARDLIEFQYESLFSERLMVHRILEGRFGRIGKGGKLLVASHHMSHAASAFFPSPYDEAAILTMDGVGEWNTLTIGFGSGSGIRLIKKIDYPHSLGMLYSAFTLYCGFKVNSGEYKLMGLAPYGKPVYCDVIRQNLIDIREDGSFCLNLSCFDFQYGRTMINGRFEELFGAPRREPESPITRLYMDVAASIQAVTEEIVIRLARSAASCTGHRENLVLAGGIALNCVANGRLLREGIFQNIWIQPAAGDAGGSIGAACLGYHGHLGQGRPPASERRFYDTCLGPAYRDAEIELFLRKERIPYHCIKDRRAEAVAELLARGQVVGLFQGRMEFGPRALGNRSIIAGAGSAQMQSEINLKIKHRESFRPFAPAVLAEEAGRYFELDVESPYMLLCAPLREERRYAFDVSEAMEACADDMTAVSRIPRSEISAVTHVDFSARIQTVSGETNREFYEILKEYERLTGCPVIVNTSFNVRGEPIVCSPQDAYTCFMRTGMDALCMGSFLVYRAEQEALADDGRWKEEYRLD